MSDKRKDIVLRFGIVYILIALLFGGVVYKILSIQLFEKEQLMKLAERQKISDIIVKPKRGNIYAADGRLLASSIPTYYIFMDTRVPSLRLDKGELFYNNLDSLAISISKFFGDKTAGAYREMILKAYRDSVGELRLYPKRISYSQLRDLRKLPLFRLGRNKSGLISKEYVRRVKPFGSLASRTIGDVFPDEAKGGMSGLEGSFDKELVGIPGVSTRQKMANKYIETVEVEPVDGLDIYSTIDIEIQDVAEKALRDTIAQLGARSGLVVVMEVKTGEIRAMVNLDYNEKSDSYFEGANHALRDQSEPGSTFKIASLMAVLDEGKVKIDDAFDTGNGIFPIGGRLMKDHNHARGGYGVLHVNEIIQASSNVGTSKMVLKSFGDNPSKYVERLYGFGLNDSLPIQMKGVAKPKIKHPKKNKDQWYKTTLAWMSIGYETQIPPIYTLTFYNSIANNGVKVKPLFVRAVKRGNEVVQSFEPEVLNPQICKPTTLKLLQRTMIEVLEGKYATAKIVRSKIVRIAGKTGTAQISQGSLGYKSGQTRHNVSFCGYFPADNPKYSCIVFITAPSGAPSGGRMAGAIFKKVAEGTMMLKSARNQDTIVAQAKRDSVEMKLPEIKAGNYRAIQTVMNELTIPFTGKSKEWVGKSTSVNHAVSFGAFKVSKNQVPNMTGMCARDAFYLLGNMGLEVKIHGRGKVISQSIKPGSKIIRGNTIELTLQ